MLKDIVKGKHIQLCDICGEEMPLNSKDKLSFSIRNSFWKVFNFEHLDICKKHRKKVLKFINQLKQEYENGLNN